MATAPITDDDERLHPVEDPSPHWSDSLYFNAWDPGTNAFVMTRMAVRANEPAATAGMIVWVDGAPVWGYGHDLGEVPPTDWDVMPIGALTYRMLASGQTWAVQVADGDHRAHLEWDGLSPATHYNGNPNGPLPRPVAWGHYEQSCRVTGDLRVGGQAIRFDGFGQRDHSWGFRHWAGLDHWHWVTCFFADGRTANLFEVHAPDGEVGINGFVHGPAGDEYVIGAERTLDRSDDGGAERFTLDLALADGTAFPVRGERAGLCLPVRPAPDQPVVVHETPVRLTAADGTAGYGIYEHLVTER